ncbi:hypothetical protein LEMLEM_LOCUS16028 [Lemmus lemmus]
MSLKVIERDEHKQKSPKPPRQKTNFRNIDEYGIQQGLVNTSQ